MFNVTGSFFVLMCHEAGASAFLHTQLYLSTNLVPHLTTFFYLLFYFKSFLT